MSSGKIPRTQHPELFHWTPGLQATDYIRATYRVASQYSGTATAMAMAIEQSAGTSMIPGYVEPGMLEHATIRVIDKIIESRDPYTSGHQRRVSDLARSIAKKLNLSEEIIDALRMAAKIHDIGKITVPAEILAKPTPLTNQEFGIIKNHPKVGYDILKDAEFPWPVAQIVLQHHERIDGSGYPLGLCGDKIILEAKILAVADVVEAMASHRPYRPALGIDRALEEISEKKGILYDPEVVDACTSVFAQNGYAFNKSAA